MCAQRVLAGDPFQDVDALLHHAERALRVLPAAYFAERGTHSFYPEIVIAFEIDEFAWQRVVVDGAEHDHT
jgi:hypothetical protein